MGRVHAVCVSEKTGERKRAVAEAVLREDHGLAGDAHAGSGRQVSLLAVESIEKMRKRLPELKPGDFAENLTTEGIDIVAIPVGSRLRVGSDVELEITQIGKKCHGPCEIYRKAGACVMPKEGVFAKVVRGGVVRSGDALIIESGSA